MDSSVPESDFLGSLDASDAAIAPFLPNLLQDIWEMGSDPETVVRLFQKHELLQTHPRKIVDLGCGKGAVLITLAQDLDLASNRPVPRLIGVDLMEAFIEEAIERAQKLNATIEFRSENILETLQKDNPVDIAIFGFDMGVLGDLTQTLSQLQASLAPGGWLFFDTACYDAELQKSVDEYNNYEEHLQAINETGFQIVDEIRFPSDKIKSINDRNTELIRSRAEELKQKHPDLSSVFDEYVQSQEEESEILNTRVFCVTWLLRNS